MRKLFFTVVAAGLLVGASSCGSSTDCVTCTVSGTSSTVCQSDYIKAGGTASGWSTYAATLRSVPGCK